jgi:hypothetical protein
MAILSRKIRKQAKNLGVRYNFFFMRANGTPLAELAALHEPGVPRPCLTGRSPDPCARGKRDADQRGDEDGQRVARRDTKEVCESVASRYRTPPSRPCSGTTWTPVLQEKSRTAAGEWEARRPWSGLVVDLAHARVRQRDGENRQP